MRRTRWPGSMLSAALLLSMNATAEPMDLLDPTPRAVEVAFEVSPRDKPTQTDTVYTPKLAAYFEPTDVPGQVRITIDRRDVEEVLLAEENPVPGSFSDFVWVFDAASGEVVSASLTGRLVKKLDWGLFETKAETRIEVDMVTQRVGGVEEPHTWLGQQLFGYCDDPAGRSCELVRGHRYDTASGYVYAVGAFQVHFGELTLHTFSPLGEAVFAEMGGDEASNALVEADSHDVSVLPAVSAGPSSH